MRHPSYILQVLDFVTSTCMKNGNHAGDSAVDDVTTETDERLCFSAYILVLIPGAGELGGGALLALSCAHSPRKESV